MDKKIQLDPNDYSDIVRSFNELNESVDKARVNFSKTLLTIYTPVSSGLLFLSTKLSLTAKSQKVSFLVITTTSVLIVLSALIEILGYFFINKNIADTYFAHVRETGKHLSKPLGGKNWQSSLVK